MFFFHPEGGDALERVAQGGCGCPIPGGIQGQADVALGSLVYWLTTLHIAGGLKLKDHYGPFQPWPFYDSVTKLKSPVLGWDIVLRLTKRVPSWKGSRASLERAMWGSRHHLKLLEFKECLDIGFVFWVGELGSSGKGNSVNQVYSSW